MPATADNGLNWDGHHAVMMKSVSDLIATNLPEITGKE
jgi:hypothetical protein